ncbi:hypothetical protein D915_011243 [Fasciola hepatica]|uniref:G-protein coupled receptors family 1 profile domain-containing protein n=1 Tax=Fasciola hepatica TaxID=6192 RepID=A0A4E0QU09_FASHE|nr:hypothetical protein D915_011243 [Fasciola hepatica]
MNGSVCDVPPDVGTSPKPSSALLYVLLAGYPVLFLIGVIGNTLSFLVLHPFGTKISGHVYLSCLAVFDTLSLFFYVLSFWTIMVLRPFLIGRGNYASVRLIDHYLMTEGRCEDNI